MGILLAFAPFLVFALGVRFIGPMEGLSGGTLTSAALLLRDWLTPGRTPKVLEFGTVVLFGGLTLYTLLSGSFWSIVGVRLCVDAGLLLIVLITMAIRQPFTVQYAREGVAREHWDSPKFLRTNYVITAVWALAFAVLVIADLVLLYLPQLPPRVGIIATILALVGAVKFTGWYPTREQGQAGAGKS